MRLNILPYLTVFLISLLVTYFATMPSAKDDKGIDFIKINPEAVEKIQFEKENLSILGTRLSAGGFWIKHVATKESKQKKSDGEDKVQEPVTTEFKANEKIIDLLAMFSPLRAIRVLGDISEFEASEFGFTENDKPGVLTITHSGGKSFSLKIGKRSYSSSNFYVLDQKSSKIILINARKIQDLERAKSRMYERKVFDVDLDDVDQATIKVGTSEIFLDHTTRDSKGKKIWKVKDIEDDNRNFNIWRDKISKLSLVRFASEEERTQIKSTSKPFLSLQLMNGAKPIETLELIRVKSTENSEEKVNYWIKSGFLGMAALLNKSRAETIEKGIESLVKSK